MKDDKRTAGEQMVHDTGSSPSMDIDSNQRAELLQEWHRHDAEVAAEEHEKEQAEGPQA